MKYHKLLLPAISFLFLILFTGHTFPVENNSGDPSSQPKLIVGIVVDQMRYDFLFRYWDKYENGGIKRLVNEGFLCRNTHYRYFPTYTGPGHASVYTGSVPAINGIVANDWYDRSKKRNLYVTEDETVTPVGTTNSSGKMSPRNMLTTTITDQLRLSNDFQSKVIGVAMKDRGAILPAGHTANAAYWFDGASGNWISSSFYMNALPKWVNDFNSKKLPAAYLKNGWTTLLPADQYTESTADTAFYEEAYKGESSTAFPHHFTVPMKDGFEILKATPFGNTVTKDFAIETIRQEQMGKGSVTDFLTVSFSSTDYVGHQFGPNSVECEDTYLRLDKDIADLLSFLDTWIGKQNVLVFLTADHGVAPAPGFLTKQKIPAGVINEKKLISTINKVVQQELGDSNLVLSIQNMQVYVNREKMKEKGVTIEKLFSIIQSIGMETEGIRNVFLSDSPEHALLPSELVNMFRNSFYPKRCGEIVLVYEPFWIEGHTKGTTHGSVFSYDTHVPLIWYGWDIKQGSGSSETSVTDIAPTIADFLNILEPSGCIGRPIQGLR